ncbi:MAG: TlpA family protein disulfide reductase [Cytophagia bacterium]|nr:TlpA family protein disulfide reductase [Cytophagia bacterium]NBW35371.1 TlpA family protein disulfide reductase [Cytophagia bacterium]
MKRKFILILLTSIFFLNACTQNKFSELKEGKWRGVFTIQGLETPFNFTVEDDTAGTIKVFLINGVERFALDSVRYERDSVIIPIDIYDAILIAKVKEDSLQGYFRKNQVAKRGIAFRAARNQAFRFEDTPAQANASSTNLTGKWSVVLTNSSGSSRYSVGKFAQVGHVVDGTLLTTTGDYRFLRGEIVGDSLKLSAFSGSNPTLLRTIILDSLHLRGEFISAGGITRFEAIKSDTAALPDPYSLTKLKEGVNQLSFSFPDINGKSVSLTDEKYKGKVVVVTILGSWCPNCLDEAAFLSPWYKTNHNRGVEIIGLSFERKDDFNFAKDRLSKLVKRFDIQYDLLFAGLADKAVAAEKLPALSEVLSFPTTIIIGKDGAVRKIHTGFSGPATGADYQEFIEHFNRDIDEALNEKINGI